MGRRRSKRGHHPKKPKKFKSKGAYQKFLAFIHMRTPKGTRADQKKSISEVTPKRHKEKTVIIRGKKHKPKLSD